MDWLKFMSDLVRENNWNIYDIAVSDGEEIQEQQTVKANPCNDSYSIAKLFTMTALGMLWDEGKLSFDERIVDIFPEYFAESDPKWQKVTVDHVARHCFGSGEGFLDIDVEDIRSYGTDDFMQVIARHPLKYEPDTQFQYTDAAFYLLSRVFTAKYGQKMDDFLIERLFTPLQVQEVAWSKCPKGYPMGATGLYIRSRDMVKLGAIYLNGGIFKGHRYLSRAYIDLAQERGYELYDIGRKGVYAKGGMAGQMLFYSLADHIVIAWHGFGEEDSNGLRIAVTEQLHDI